ncbi:ArsR/SmtB family transcription factor [Kushneria phyllosphaerae]|uniref:Biofilm growth-associated repressor n=1 Tax=Kushneria phyllosphaerae TaxID=2100822 RepID=A0A2R8CQR0_9GAMM|nr:metalloregulator ArsR/SmtB family transcription factor [Kushneria phyllosphaerae]SPJ35236.1 Biofilm growth-associated repressor [Kushneria phyllosphaerae]
MNARTIFILDDHSAIDGQHDHEVTIFRAMAHPDRYRVLKILAAEGEMQVGQINEWIALGQSALSQNLKVLRDAGLVDTRRESQRIYYSFRKSQGASLPQSVAELFG